MPRSKLKDSEVAWLYTAGEPVKQIAAAAGITRQGVFGVLGRAGVKLNRVGEPKLVRCEQCGAEFKRHRWHIEKARRQYCSGPCYWKSRSNPGFVAHRQGQRYGRAKMIACGWVFRDGEIVHHKDSNQRNNEAENLCVFSSQADHMKHHHGLPVEPIFDPSSPLAEARKEQRRAECLFAVESSR